jgi:hypothetical protein
MKNFLFVFFTFINLNCFAQSVEIEAYPAFFSIPGGVRYTITKDGPGFVHSQGAVSVGTYVNNTSTYFQTFTPHLLRIIGYYDAIFFDIGTDANVYHNGFIKLGSDAPAIALGKITGTTALTEGALVTYAHGLNASKIISMKLIIDYASNGFVNDEYVYNPGFQAALVYDATSIYITNYTANSYNILNKPFKVLITYTN